MCLTGTSSDSGAVRRGVRHPHRLTQDGNASGSPTQSPRRRRKHRQLSSDADNNASGTTVSGILPNGYSDPHESSQQDVTISLSALSRGRIPDSFEIEETTLNDNTHQHLSSVPNIECRQSALGATLNYSNADHVNGASAQACGVDNHSASVVGISPNLSSTAGHTHRNTMGENTAEGMNGACNGNDRKEINNEQRRNKIAKDFKRSIPPPLPPRRYKTKGLSVEKLRAQERSNTSVTQTELSVPEGFPSKENTSSFDSMEAFSGSNENMALNSIVNSRNSGTGNVQDVNAQELGDEAAAGAALSNHTVTTLNVRLEGTVRGQSETDDIQTDGPVTPNQNKESFDESGATSESYESASESVGTGEKAFVQTAESPIKGQNNACTAAGSFVTSIAAQLARIPTIESAVSERSCCPTGVKQQNSVESPNEEVQQISGSMQDSTHSNNETNMQSIGAKAHLVVTAQPTSQETSRPVLMGVTHSHAVPLTAVIPVASELSRQDSTSSEHSDANGQQGSTEHTSVHIQQIGNKQKQSPPQQKRVAVVKPVPVPRNVNKPTSPETVDVVFSFTASVGDNVAAGQQEDEPLSPRRKLLSDHERQQNRQQIQEQLARWHQQRRQAEVSPPPGRPAAEAAASQPSGPSGQGFTSQQHGAPSHSAIQSAMQSVIPHEQELVVPTTAPVMSNNVSVLLNTNSTASSRTTQSRQPPPPPPRDGSTLSTPVTTAAALANSITAPVTAPVSASIPPQPPPRDGSSLTSNENQPVATTVSSMTTMPFAMTTVLTTGCTNTVSQPSQQPSNQVTMNTQQPNSQLAMHICNNNRDFSATREAIQQRLLQWHQQQQQLHRLNAGQTQHHSAQNISTSLPSQQHSLNHPVLPQLYALQQQGRSNHQVSIQDRNLPRISAILKIV